MYTLPRTMGMQHYNALTSLPTIYIPTYDLSILLLLQSYNARVCSHIMLRFCSHIMLGLWQVIRTYIATSLPTIRTLNYYSSNIMLGYGCRNSCEFEGRRGKECSPREELFLMTFLIKKSPQESCVALAQSVKMYNQRCFTRPLIHIYIYSQLISL